MLLKIEPATIHLWVVDLERARDARLLESYRTLLDTEETERWQRFSFEEHRHQYLVSHALVRSSLSRYAPIDPAGWRFVANRSGRPEIAGEQFAWLRFNLSHTTGMAVVAVAADLDVGVDIEDCSRPGRALAAASTFFAPAEATELENLSVERREARFFEIWTLKEAYLKARGAGLSLSLTQFAFQFDAGLPPRIAFGPQIADDPAAWQFVQIWLSPRHVTAVATRRPRHTPLALQCRLTVPLADE